MMVLLTFFCMVSMVVVLWEVAALKFTHNKGLLSFLLYFIIFSLKYPVYSDFFRWHPCNVPFADLMKGK